MHDVGIAIPIDAARTIRVASRALTRTELVRAYGHCSVRLRDSALMVRPPKPLGRVATNDDL